MLSRKMKQEIGKVLQQTADNHGVTLAEVRSDIEEIITEGMNSDNAVIRLRWNAMPRANKRPTVEEFMAYTIFRVGQRIDDGK